MSLKSDYALSVRKELGRFAVWEPGSPLMLGDYGLIREKTFEKLGNIEEFKISVSPDDTNDSKVARFEFQSRGTRSSRGAVDVKIAPPTQPSSGNGQLKIEFQEANALLIRSHDSKWTAIKNVQKLATKLHARGSWKRSWAVVAGIRSAALTTVLMSAKPNSCMLVEGSAQVLSDFDLGKLEASSRVRITGDIAVKYIGVEGPMLLELIRLRFFGGVARQATTGPSIDLPAYEVISPDASTEDDAT